jgi:hypothetical protein
MAAISKVVNQFYGFFLKLMGLILQGISADPDAVSGAGVLFYRSDTDKLRLQTEDGTFHYLATEDSALFNGRVPVSIPVVLSKHTNGSIAARFTPGFKGTIRKITASVTDPATTGSKLATFTPAIATVATTGGALALTSANCTPVGAKVDGSSITALNAFGATDEITIAASSVTAFVEGQVVIYLFLDPAVV